MDKVAFGVTVTIVGMGGTMICLLFLSLLMDLMKIIFPYKETKEKEAK